MSATNPTHAEAAELAAVYLPEYLATWIAGILRETHTLPALIHHQDRIAQDILGMAISSACVPVDSSSHTESAT